ncbi:MAG: 30S ribosomal protein S27ae, partial [Thermoplasmatota archaeon]
MPGQANSLYRIEGDKLVRTNKQCPKCGVGVFMA